MLSTQDNIVSHISNFHGTPYGEAAGEIMKALALPEEMPTRLTTDGGILTFLSDVGCTFRIIDNIEHPQIHHDHMLEPLGVHVKDFLRFEINPGVLCPAIITRIETDNLINAFNDADIIFSDVHDNNIGMIPGQNKPHYVVIDAGAFTNFNEKIGDIKKLLRAKTSKVDITPQKPQKEIYGSLQAAFNKAWPQNENRPDEGLLKKFWSDCKDAKAQGLLLEVAPRF